MERLSFLDEDGFVTDPPNYNKEEYRARIEFAVEMGYRIKFKNRPVFHGGCLNCYTDSFIVCRTCCYYEADWGKSCRNLNELRRRYEINDSTKKESS